MSGDANARAVRLVGGVMLAGGLLLFSPSLLLLIDGAFSLRLFSCSLLLGVPLLIGGVTRLVSPERH